MRKILFRGKNDDGFMVYGDYSEHTDGTPYIRYWTSPRLGEKAYRVDRVDPQTVGQYTGVDTVKGRKIFEGDEVKAFSERYEFSGRVCFEDGAFGLTWEHMGVRRFCPLTDFANGQFDFIGG